MAQSVAETILADEEGPPLLVLLNLMASPIFGMLWLLDNTTDRHDSYVDDRTYPHG
jgi:hypothetical protein